MQTVYLNALIYEIKKHHLILENDILSSEQWSKKSFIECSKVIGTTLLNLFSNEDILNYGTSVSYKTLENIYKNRYVLKCPLDRRCLITLTKLSRFIGYDSWSDFTKKVDDRKIIDHSKPTGSHPYIAEMLNEKTTHQFGKVY